MMQGWDPMRESLTMLSAPRKPLKGLCGSLSALATMKTMKILRSSYQMGRMAVALTGPLPCNLDCFGKRL
jgi:hypothetical protein